MGQTRCVMVLGMHRSGTSATAGLLQLMGLEMGNELMPATSFNPKGYFEHPDIRDFNDRMLQACGSCWDDCLPLLQDWRERDEVFGIQEEIRSWLQKQLGEATTCVIKDPRICRLLALWQQVLADLKIEVDYVFVYRNPLSVITSLGKRDAFSAEKSTILWLDHVLEAERQTRFSRRFWVKYEELTQQPVAVMGDLIHELKLPLAHQLDTQRHTVEQFIDPKLNHGYSEAIQRLHPWATEVYSLLLQLHQADHQENINDLYLQLDANYTRFQEARALLYTPENQLDAAQLEQFIEHERKPALHLIWHILKDRWKNWRREVHSTKSHEQTLSA